MRDPSSDVPQETNRTINSNRITLKPLTRETDILFRTKLSPFKAKGCAYKQKHHLIRFNNNVQFSEKGQEIDLRVKYRESVTLNTP